MHKETYARLYHLIESSWTHSEVWPDFKELMGLALAPAQADHSNYQHYSSSRWMILPGLCSQAVGGVPVQADLVTAAWFLLYRAAHLMDSVEDADEPEGWWANLGPGAALNTATGLFFTAYTMLQDLQFQSFPEGVADEIIQEFNRCFLMMCSGQHRDLTLPEVELEEYWRIAEAKSGVFFGLAAWAGARLATDSTERLDSFRRFGNEVGLLIQVSDDLEELQAPTKTLKALDKRSLPVLYALEVLPSEARNWLMTSFNTAVDDQQSNEEARRLIDGSGAAFYLLAEVDRHYRLALEDLEKAGAQPPASHMLRALLERYNVDRYLENP